MRDEPTGAMTTRAVTLVARTSAVSETQALAAELAALAEPGDLIVLAGDLGAGKTAFVQGFGRGLGVTEPITSPTFTLAQQYEGRLLVHHLDVYRLDQLGEVAELGLGELLDDGGVVLIEWGDAILPVLPNDYLEVRLMYPPVVEHAGTGTATGGSSSAGTGRSVGESSADERSAGSESGAGGESAPGDDDRRIVLRAIGSAWGRRQVSLLHAIAPWAEAPNGTPAPQRADRPAEGGGAPC
ncbi:MAG TPA: tRNA (adenosine(37)-N6)-threonylcarbamoyltransferase complex ATPase subunit type 1 TsaE [Acidimicrobiales bacterium]|nr:tRNA (adenosine(37)-N6)-threonylcarbamoyltransferase complex ATPase subunit type 1 TsaE [Acidimicrobiales bacterium]